MKFHIIAGLLFSLVLSLLYFIFVGVSKDFEDARPQIQKEAVASIKKRRREHLETHAEKSESKTNLAETDKQLFNPNVFKPVAQVADARPDSAPSGVMIERIGNDEYWCRDNDEARKEMNPVRCYYSAACYGCTGSTVIPPDPDAGSVIPFCDNGVQAEIFSIECCPKSAAGGQLECPSARECLHADAVPETYCSCNNRPDCRYVSIGNQVQCVCIQ